MQEQNTTLDKDIRIVGFSAVIDKDHVADRIGALWQRAAEAGLLREGSPSFAAYFAYEDQLANKYRVLVGSESDGDPTEGQEAIVLPAGDYVRFADEGEAVATAMRLWRHVWSGWKEGARRTFGIDFERYDGTPDRAQVALYVGVR